VFGVWCHEQKRFFALLSASSLPDLRTPEREAFFRGGDSGGGGDKWGDGQAEK